MKTLDRYVLRQFVRIFAICVLGVPFVFILIDLTEQIDTYIADELTRGSVFLHYLFQVPYQMLLSFPIAALLAAVFTVSAMTRRFEISAAKAGGISFHRIVRPILLAGAAISLLALALTEVVPEMNRRSADALGETRSQREGVRTSFVYRGEGGRWYYVRRLSSGRGEISEIRIAREGSEEQAQAGRLHAYDATAGRARWDPETGRWVMEEGRIRFFPSRDQTAEFRFAELRQRSFTETPTELLARAKGEEEMGYTELGEYIEALERSGARTGKLRVERQMKIAFPFSCLVIVLFGVPLATSSRRGGASLSIGIALATTIVMLVLIRVAQAMGASGILPVTAAAWLPNGLFLAAGLVLMAKVRT
ncbi:MAG: LptF/LptG family permease [Gemmatimonadota bacterium]|nr:LptF/LptG family permease [Gemmatimonadota bacterium]